MDSALVVFSFDGREIYSEYLRANGFVVYDAGQPEGAMAKLEAGLIPGVVVCDAVFLGSGIDAASFVRTLRQRLDDAVSIIVVAGLVREEDRESLRAAGADAFLVKPVLPASILYEVKRALILRRSGRRLPWNWPRRPAGQASASEPRAGKIAS
jgi:CheY-like chemotaxis protein